MRLRYRPGPPALPSYVPGWPNADLTAAWLTRAAAQRGVSVDDVVAEALRLRHADGSARYARADAGEE